MSFVLKSVNLERDQVHDVNFVDGYTPRDIASN